MKELLDKISSYNIFNFLLPGILFAVFGSRICNVNIVYDNILIGAFIYYFIGLVISRIGSLIIEPLLRWTGFVKFAEYSEYISAASNDSKIDLLSETNNMFRTFISMILLLLLMKGYFVLAVQVEFLKSHETLILVVLLLILFLFAYRKQTKYITSRIKSKK